MLNTTFITIVVVAILVILLVLASYIKAPPSFAYIVSGLNRKPRTYIGKGGFRIPGLERLDKVFLGQVTVDIKTSRSVPTNDFINVNVDAVAKIQVIGDPEGIRLAAKNFLNMTGQEISRQVQDSLEGNMREVIGGISLRDININRDAFSDAIMEKAQKDMNALGLNIISCNIQNVTDDKNLRNALAVVASAANRIDLGEELLKRGIGIPSLPKVKIPISTSPAKRLREVTRQQGNVGFSRIGIATIGRPGCRGRIVGLQYGELSSASQALKQTAGILSATAPPGFCAIYRRGTLEINVG